MTFGEKIRNAVSEGCVLLKNENSTLPFSGEDSVALFGRCQIDFYKSGTGSGGSVHVPYSVNLAEGFKKLSEEKFPVPQIDLQLEKIYADWVKANPYDNGNGEWASEPWCQKEMVLSDETVKCAAEKNNKAVFVIGRTAGEDQDNKAEPGSYYLTELEKDCLKKICAYFEKVTVLLNVSNIVDLSWIENAEYKNHITAVLFCWHGGMEGGSGTADVLCGKSCPSGKLSDTIAYKIEDYPSSKNFGLENDVFYEEDIFTGYRYFSTFAKDKVQFPFGFGLSYTKFSLKAGTFETDGKNFSVNVTVTNTGNFCGKETVQIYCQCPQGKLGKSSRVLCAFGKTSLLEKGESETLNLKWNVKDFSSYDDCGAAGFESSYVIEEGTYSFFAGTDCLASEKIFLCGNKEFSVEKTYCLEKLSRCLSPEKEITVLTTGQINDDGTYEKCCRKVKPASNCIEQKLSERIFPSSKKPDEKITFAQVVKDKSLAQKFTAQLSECDLKTLVRGEGMMSQKVTAGIASAFGGLSKSLHDYGVVAAGCADGPSGIRLDNGKEASLVPIGTLLACTWNTTLVEDLYSEVGKEMAQKKIDILLGPGCNIHRNPLNGRNFEYFSEDPLLTGKMASAVLKGLHSAGAIGTVKHFALNNQETFRRKENSIATERAVREIYLKPFEIAVKEGNARSIMTSYNAVNGHWSASNFDLNTSILRNEWNYTGVVMSDWWAAMNDVVKGGNSTVKDLASMVKARNDVYMVVENDSAEKNGNDDNLDEALKNGTLTLDELRLCAKDIILFLTETFAAKSPLRPLKNEIKITSELKDVPEKYFYPQERIQINSEKSSFYVKIENSGFYKFYGYYFKDGGDTLSQSITNILINGESAGSLECRSTDGKIATAIALQLELKQGFYHIQLEPSKPGIEVKEMMIAPENNSPVTAGIFE